MLADSTKPGPEAKTVVLVIDDDPIYQEITGNFIEQLGARNVLQAVNGAEAVQILRESGNEIGLILSDLHMPDMDGVEFLQHLNQSGCKIPLVIVSSAIALVARSAEDLARAYSLNLIGVLGKPVNFGKLRDLIQPHLA